MQLGHSLEMDKDVFMHFLSSSCIHSFIFIFIFYVWIAIPFSVDFFLLMIFLALEFHLSCFALSLLVRYCC